MIRTADLFARKLLLVTGKGGVGKTLTTVALGQLAASKGKRVLLVESLARDQIAPLFGVEPVGHHETVLGTNLACINLNAAGNFREYITKYLGQRGLFENVFNHRVVRSFFNTIPGLAEVMLLGRLFYTCEHADDRPDLVILDAFASGHFLSLMTTPDAILRSGLAGPLVRDTQKVRDFLADPERCGIVVTTTAEELVMSETREFLPKLEDQAPARLLGVIINRMLPSIQGTAKDLDAADLHLRAMSLRVQKSVASFRTSLAESGPALSNLPIGFAPEFGFIQDPLEPDFHERFLADFDQPVERGGRRG